VISTSDFRNGTMFEMDGQLLQVVTVEHIKLARAGAVIKAKLRNLLTGAIFEQSFRSADKYKTVRIDKNEAQYLYADGTHHYFMDPKTYDQVPIDESLLEGKRRLPAEVPGQADRCRAPNQRGAQGRVDRPGIQGGHRVRRVKTGEAGDGRDDPGSTLHSAWRRDQGRHAHPDLHGEGVEPAPTGSMPLMGQNGSLGAVRVANEVIASIAALAACEVEGVEGMDEAAARHFGDWVRRQSAHRGVRVHIEADRSIHLEVFLTVESDAKLAEVAGSVQSNVVEATERMLGLEVGEVNVFVSSVAFAS
jgi:translation elongation factor P/translation initiation factor 5A/uncharacterized alkaline shock family protein YloU